MTLKIKMALYLANNFGAKLSVFLSHDGASGGETGLSTSVAVYYVTHYSTLRRDVTDWNTMWPVAPQNLIAYPPVL